MQDKNSTARWDAICADMVGQDCGALSITLPVEHTVEHDWSVAMGNGRTCHVVIARCYSPLLQTTLTKRTWLAVYRVHVSRDRNGGKTRSYGAFNYARTMDEAKQMSDDLIKYAQDERDEVAQRIAGTFQMAL